MPNPPGKIKVWGPNGELGYADADAQLPPGWSLAVEPPMMASHTPESAPYSPPPAPEPSMQDKLMAALDAAGAGFAMAHPLLGPSYGKRGTPTGERMREMGRKSPKAALAGGLISGGLGMIGGGALGAGARGAIRKGAAARVAPQVAESLPIATTTKLRGVLREIQGMTAPGTEGPILDELLERGIMQQLGQKAEKELFNKALGPGQAIRDLTPAMTSGIGAAAGTARGGFPWGTVVGSQTGSYFGRKLSQLGLPTWVKEAAKGGTPSTRVRWPALFNPFEDVTKALGSPAVHSQMANMLPVAGAAAGGAVSADPIRELAEYLSQQAQAKRQAESASMRSHASLMGP